MMKCNALFYHFQLTTSIIESYSSYLNIYPCLLQVTLCTFVFIQYWTDSYSYHNNDNNYVTYAHKKPTNGIKKQRRKFVIVWIARKSSTVWMALSTYQLRLFSFLSLFLTLLFLCFSMLSLFGHKSGLLNHILQMFWLKKHNILETLDCSYIAQLMKVKWFISMLEILMAIANKYKEYFTKKIYREINHQIQR